MVSHRKTNVYEISQDIAHCLLFSLILFTAPLSSMAGTAYWPLMGDLLSITGKPPLLPESFLVESSPAIRFVTDAIDERERPVLFVERGTALRMSHGWSPHESEDRIRRYTLILDIKLPQLQAYEDALKRPHPPFVVLFNPLVSLTSTQDDSVSAWGLHVKPETERRGVPYDQQLFGNWRRYILVHDGVQRRIKTYVDGALVSSTHLRNPDDLTFCLHPIARLFASSQGYDSDLWVAGVQLRHDLLTDEDVAKLGSASAEGIPIPSAPEFKSLAIDPGDGIEAGNQYLVEWSVVNPQGFALLDLYQQGDYVRTLAELNVRDSNYAWRIFPNIDEGENYQLRLKSRDNLRNDILSDPFAIRNPRTPLSPLFEKQLLVNPNFEQGLSGWMAMQGAPRTMSQIDRSGAQIDPIRGRSSIVSNQAGDWRIEQRVDLLQSGFPPDQLDDPIRVKASIRVIVAASSEHSSVSCLDRAWITLHFENAVGERLATLQSARSIGFDSIAKVKGYLPLGTRAIVFRVQAQHLCGQTNDCLVDNAYLALSAYFTPSPPRITLGPWLQDPRPDSISVVWETDNNSEGAYVQWGEESVAERRTSPIETRYIGEGQYAQRAILQPLRPGAEYQYRVAIRGEISETRSFKTKQEKSVTKVAWLPGCERNLTTTRTHMRRIQAREPHLALCVGAGESRVDEKLALWLQLLAGPFTTMTAPFLFTPSCDEWDEALRWAYGVIPDDHPWYAISCGERRILFLDSCYKACRNFDIHPLQDEWLLEEMQSLAWQESLYRIVVFHHSPFEFANGGDALVSAKLSNQWMPLFEQYGVDLVVSGAKSGYSRGERNGIVYVSLGAISSDGDRTAVEPPPGWIWLPEQSAYGFCYSHGERLIWTVYGENDNKIDGFEIRGGRLN